MISRPYMSTAQLTVKDLASLFLYFDCFKLIVISISIIYPSAPIKNRIWWGYWKLCHAGDFLKYCMQTCQVCLQYTRLNQGSCFWGVLCNTGSLRICTQVYISGESRIHNRRFSSRINPAGQLGLSFLLWFYLVSGTVLHRSQTLSSWSTPLRVPSPLTYTASYWATGKSQWRALCRNSAAGEKNCAMFGQPWTPSPERTLYLALFLAVFLHKNTTTSSISLHFHWLKSWIHDEEHTALTLEFCKSTNAEFNKVYRSLLLF